MEEQPVLIVGAGPVGLALAVALDHLGVGFRIIDRADTPARLSKAAGIQARTLEILHDLDLAEPFLERGVRMTASEVRHHGEVVAGIDFRSLAHESRYPFLLGLPQSETEAILTERLADRGIAVERGVELTECRSDAFSVAAILRRADGSTEAVRPRWIAGCDGPQSRVRDALRIPFTGADDRTSYAVADVELEWDQAPDTAMLLLEDHGRMQLHPISPTRWRLAVDCGPIAGAGRPAPPTPAELQELCDLYLPTPARVGAVDWATYYCVLHCHAPHFRSRRAFLLGDAAHMHSPITFQGMNAGIQDAWNLGWKLDLAERGTATDLLLDSYDAERRAVDVRVTHDRAELERRFDLRVPAGADDLLFPFVAAAPGYERTLARETGDLTYAYRSSAAVAGHRADGPTLVGAETPVHPGDLAPDAPFTTDSGLPVRDGRSYVSLVFTGDDPVDAAVLDVRLPGNLRIRPVIVAREPGVRSRSGASVVTDSGGAIHRIWGVTRPTHVLVRPDGYVGWRSEPPDGAALRTFLARLHGAGTPTRPPATEALRQTRLAG